jgi:hypothetical protein
MLKMVTGTILAGVFSEIADQVRNDVLRRDDVLRRNEVLYLQ